MKKPWWSAFVQRRPFGEELQTIAPRRQVVP
jgi:hypothetical protein